MLHVHCLFMTFFFSSYFFCAQITVSKVKAKLKLDISEKNIPQLTQASSGKDFTVDKQLS